MFKKLFKTSKYAFLIAFSALTLAACGGSDIGPEDPAVVMEKARQASLDIETGYTEMAFDFEISDGFEHMVLDGEFSGNFDQTDPEDLKANVNLDLNADLDIPSEDLEMEAELSMGFILLDDDAYFNLKSIEANAPEFEVVKPFVDLYTNQWAQLPLEKMIPEDLYEEFEANLSLQKQIQEIAKDAKFLKVTEDHGIKKLNGRSAYHYSVTFNDDEIENYIGEVFAPQGIEELDDPQIQAGMGLILPVILSSIEKFDMWIDAETYHTLKMEFEFFLDIEALDGGVFDLSFSVKNSNIDEPFVIEAPEDTINLDPFFEGFGEGFFGSLKY